MAKGGQMGILGQVLFQQGDINILLDLLQADNRGSHPVQFRSQSPDPPQA
jgi:hypothetical protein